MSCVTLSMATHLIHCRELWLIFCFPTLSYVFVLLNACCSSILNIELSYYFFYNSSFEVLRVWHFCKSDFKESQVRLPWNYDHKDHQQKVGLSNLRIALGDAAVGFPKTCLTALIIQGYLSAGWLMWSFFPHYLH